MRRTLVAVASILALQAFVDSLPVPEVPANDDGGAFPWGNEVELASQPDVADMAEEARTSTGVSSSMKNSGMGHMVGRNDRTSKKEDAATQEVAQKVRSEDDQIAQVTEDVEALKAEEQKIKADLNRVQAANSKKAKAVEVERQARMKKVMQEEAEHLASVKREASMKVKHVRVDSEKHLEMERTKAEENLGYEKEAYASEEAELDSKIKALQEKAHITDKEAEEIFQKHRAMWKAKRKLEVATNGVKSNLKEVTAKGAELSQKFQELEDLKVQAREHLKKAVQEKLLMAAKVKNLHVREQTLEDKQSQVEKSNQALKHQLDEVRLTQESNAAVVSESLDEAIRTKASVVESAKADAEVAETEFKKNVLGKAEDDIARLKVEIAQRKLKEQRMQDELLAQESSVQAELKEADDVVSKAKWDLSVAQEQAKIELSTARDKSLDIVDEARRKAAALREHAREKGMHESEAEYVKEVAQHEKEAETLKEEEEAVSKLAVEFEEKTAKQIQEKEASMREEVDNKRRAMDENLVRRSETEVKELRAEEDRRLRDIQQQRADAAKRVDAAEDESRQLAEEVKKLEKQKVLLKKALVKDKTAWTYNQVMSKYPEA